MDRAHLCPDCRHEVGAGPHWRPTEYIYGPTGDDGYEWDCCSHCGAELAEWSGAEPSDRVYVLVAGKAEQEQPQLPTWDADRGELRYRGELVRKLRPIAQACTILAAFSEDGWPARIDNPLPPEVGLSRVIRDLNAGLQLLRFGRDGTGNGILWSTK